MPLTAEQKIKCLDSLGKLSKKDTARFLVSTIDSGIFQGGGTCHGRLGSTELTSMKRESVITATDQPNYHSRKANYSGFTAEDHEQYLDYLLNRSPFHTAFVDKDAAKCIADGGIEVTAHVPSNLMAAACVATRSCWERHSMVAKTFCILSNGGVKEDLALFIANMATYSCNSAEDGMKVSWSRSIEDHHCLESNYFSWENLSNFMQHKPVKLNKLYSESVNYSGINALFTGMGQHPEDSVSVARWVLNNWGPKKSSSGKTNPFPVAKPAADSRVFLGMAEAMSGMIEMATGPMLDKLKEVGYA